LIITHYIIVFVEVPEKNFVNLSVPKKIQLVLSLLLTHSGFAQLPDSITFQVDSLVQSKSGKLDSIHHDAELQFTQLKHEYDSIGNIFTSSQHELQKKLDSLSNLSLPTISSDSPIYKNEHS
jgi:hypothetical protein